MSIVSMSRGIDPALDVHDVLAAGPFEAPHHVQDRVDLADVREELVAQPLARARAADQARDVHERGASRERSSRLRCTRG